MKNINWKRIAIILAITFTVVVVIAFGIGYAFGGMDTAKWLINKAVDMGVINGIGKAELMEYFLKLKGGGL